jgi:hypothetical protein
MWGTAGKLEGAGRSVPSLHLFARHSGTGFVAEVNPKAGVGFRAGAAFPTRTFSTTTTTATILMDVPAFAAMAYFKDLTRYEYSKDPFKCAGELYNVGWLERCASYPNGVVAPELTEKLLALCKFPVNRYRGWHGCHFCRENPVRIADSEGEFCLGDGEIRVLARVYRAGATNKLPSRSWRGRER